MSLADAAATLQLSKDDWAGIAILIGFVVFIAKSGGTAPVPMSDEEVAQCAEDAGEYLKKRSAPDSPEVSMDEYFSAQPYGERPQELARVLEKFVEIGAIRCERDGVVHYKPSTYLIMRETVNHLRNISEKDLSNTITVGDNSFANIGDNNLAVDASMRHSNQVIEITNQQSKIMEELIRDLYRFALHLSGEDRATADGIQRDLEEAARKRSAQAVPGIAQRMKGLLGRLPATQPYISVVSAGLSLLQQAMNLHL